MEKNRTKNDHNSDFNEKWKVDQSLEQNPSKKAPGAQSSGQPVKEEEDQDEEYRATRNVDDTNQGGQRERAPFGKENGPLNAGLQQKR